MNSLSQSKPNEGRTKAFKRQTLDLDPQHITHLRPSISYYNVYETEYMGISARSLSIRHSKYPPGPFSPVLNVRSAEGCRRPNFTNKNWLIL